MTAITATTASLKSIKHFPEEFNMYKCVCQQVCHSKYDDEGHIL